MFYASLPSFDDSIHYKVIFMLLTSFKLFEQACITANCVLQLDL